MFFEPYWALRLAIEALLSSQLLMEVHLRSTIYRTFCKVGAQATTSLEKSGRFLLFLSLDRWQKPFQFRSLFTLLLEIILMLLLLWYQIFHTMFNILFYAFDIFKVKVGYKLTKSGIKKKCRIDVDSHCIKRVCAIWKIFPPKTCAWWGHMIRIKTKAGAKHKSPPPLPGFYHNSYCPCYFINLRVQSWPDVRLAQVPCMPAPLQKALAWRWPGQCKHRPNPASAPAQ